MKYIILALVVSATIQEIAAGMWCQATCVALGGVAAFAGSKAAGFGQKGAKKGSWAATAMSLVAKLDIGKKIVGGMQSTGAGGTKGYAAIVKQCKEYCGGHIEL